MSRIKWFSAIRAYGLFLVLGYHLFFNLLPGGFLGVDIFFTFSGFLITALIMEQVRKNGSFKLFQFYKRRVQRILVPLFLAIALTLPLALLISPDFMVGIGHQVASALSFITNWYNIFAGTSYEAQLLPPLFIHTWSLAVEMQFYLLWGLLCALMVAFSRAVFGENTQKVYSSFRVFVLILSGIIAVLSFVYMEILFATDTDLNIIYFNTISRLFPFYIGSFAAAIWGMQDKQDVALKQKLFSKYPKLITAALLIIVFSAAGLILFDFSQHRFEDEFMYHYGFLFTSLLTVVLIYGTHALHILTPKNVKEPWLLRAAADLSYDVYLVHWPLYIVFSALIINNLAASLVTLVVTFILSAVMVYGAERVLIPPRRAPKLKRKRLAWTAVCVPVALGVVVGAFVIINAPVKTSIEMDFSSGNISQDARSIAILQQGVEAINEAPVVYMAAIVPLQANLLPAPTEPAPPTLVEDDAQIVPPDGQAPPDAQAPPEPTPQPPPPDVAVTGGVTLIGDSVPLGAQTAMLNTISDIYVDAEVGRPVSAGAGIIRSLQERGELREYVVIALGTNGTNNFADLMTEIIDAVNPGHRVIFITPFDGRQNDNARIVNSTAEWMRGLPNQYGFITIADWNALISPQQEHLAGDRVHMGDGISMQLYADMVAEAIQAASQKPGK